MIALEALCKSYPSSDAADAASSDTRGIVALDELSLSVPRGEIHGIVGPSGAGKSTLVRCVTLLERPTSGRVVVDGVDLTALDERELRDARRRIGMVFQNVNLLDSRTIAANVSYPLEVAGVAKAQRRERVAELLDIVGLGDRAKAHPAQLSGGQRQRIGIARALAARPDVLLCDEPTSALDPTTTRSILSLIRDIRDRLGITVLLITHEMAAVRAICDSVSLLDKGRIIEGGPLLDAVAAHESRLGHELIPLPELPVGEARASIEVAYSTRDIATSDVLLKLASVAASQRITAGSIETIDGQQIGRFQLDVPQSEREASITALRSAGLFAEAVR